ncbi:MAG: hypothetical protein ACK4Z4_13625, partial [Ferrovibrio sp.]
NPPPLGRPIGRAYLRALEYSSKMDDTSGEYVGRATMEILERELPVAAVPSRQRRLFWILPASERS